MRIDEIHPTAPLDDRLRFFKLMDKRYQTLIQFILSEFNHGDLFSFEIAKELDRLEKEMPEYTIFIDACRGLLWDMIALRVDRTKAEIDRDQPEVKRFISALERDVHRLRHLNLDGSWI